MDGTINYSIIIPHKDIPNLLQRCLNSIPRRDDIQIIVVDDNSNSEKVDFNHFPGMGEQCIEIYLTKDGKGAGYARNVGMQHAKGKWLLFSDADDYFSENMLEIVDKYRDSEYDVVYFDSYMLDGKTCKKLDTNLWNKRYNQKKVSLKHFSILNVTPWGKLINRNFVEDNHFYFEETIVSNDVFFAFQLACNQQKACVSSDIIYNYLLMRKGSLTSSMPENIYDVRFHVLIHCNQYLQSHSASLYCISTIPMILKARKYSYKKVFQSLRLAYKNTVLFSGIIRSVCVLFSIRV